MGRQKGAGHVAKIVNCWNEWDPLKRVIIGRPEGTNVLGREMAKCPSPAVYLRPLAIVCGEATIRPQFD